MKWDVFHVGDITQFVVDVTRDETNTPEATYDVGSYEREYLVEDLKEATEYRLCVTMWARVGGVEEDETGCVDVTTESDAAPVKQAGSNVTTILAVVFAVLGCIVLLAVVAFLVVRYRSNAGSPCAKWTKQKTSTSNSHGLPSRTDMPAMGYNSKRFSKAKHSSAEIQNQNMANAKMAYHNHSFNPDKGVIDNHTWNPDKLMDYPQKPYKDIHLESDLQRFTPEERERILSMLSTHGGSAISHISLGNQRYVPDLPPRPAGMVEGYLYPDGYANSASPVEGYLDPLENPGPIIGPGQGYHSPQGPPRPVGPPEGYLTPQQQRRNVQGYYNPQVVRDERADGEEPHIYVEIDDNTPAEMSKECYI